MSGSVAKSSHTHNAKKYRLSRAEFIHSFSFKLSPYSHYCLSDCACYVVNEISRCDDYFTLGYPYDDYLRTPFSASKYLSLSLLCFILTVA